MICAVCKYAPVELFAGFGERWCGLTSEPEATPLADGVAHANLCGFGKALIQAALTGEVGDLLLTNCCDVMRRSYEVIADYDRRQAGEGTLAATGAPAGEGGAAGGGAPGRPAGAPRRFLHLMDLPHSCGPCQVEQLARGIRRVRDAYAAHSGRTFDLRACQEACARASERAAAPARANGGAYVGILGTRAGEGLDALVADSFDVPVRDLACVGARSLALPAEALQTRDEDAFFRAYAQALLAQVPCMRMTDTSGRRALFEDPNLVGVVYHTTKFCDFYGAELAEVQARSRVPVLALETDFTRQSAGQLRTRVEAFAESLGRVGRGRATKAAGEDVMPSTPPGEAEAASAGATSASGRPATSSAPDACASGHRLFAGVDSGSTSTDVVVVNEAGEVVATHIVATGGGAAASAHRCLDEALSQAGIARERVAGMVATGYGRDYLGAGDAVTEITCHARGARALCADARCVIDIGGQDSKAIALAPDGAVANFAMNDKCAAGTGRFLEMMARALQLTLPQMASAGLTWHEDIKISSMCSVFAESEVVSLVAQSKATGDIVHGINESVAAKTVALVRRVGGRGPFVMTGGVAHNEGVVRAIERRLGEPLVVPESAQLAGALGAALIARDRVVQG